MREYRRVYKNVNSSSEGSLTHLDGDRYLNRTPQELDPWYYIGEWAEIGLDEGDLERVQFHEVLVIR